MTVSAPATAFEVSYNLGYQLEYSDNVNRTPDQEINSWSNAAIAGVRARESGGRLEFLGNAATTYRVYRVEEIADESISSLGMFGRWHFVPGFFAWTVEDYLNNTLTNPLAADAPANRQHINVFSTGPDLWMRISALHILHIAARASRHTFSEVDADSSRSSATIDWTYRVTPSSQVTADASGERVEFDNDVLNQNFERRDQTLTWRHETTRTRLNIAAGVTEIQYVSGEMFDGYRRFINYQTDIGGGSSLTFGALSELTDAGRVVQTAGAAALQTGGNAAGPIAAATGEIYTETAYSVAWTRRTPTKQDEFRLFTSKREYEPPMVREELAAGVLASATRYFGESYSGQIFASRTDSEFPDTNREDKDTALGIQIRDRLSPSLTLSASLIRYDRESTDPLLGYVEHRFLLAINYQPLAQRPGQRGADVH